MPQLIIPEHIADNVLVLLEGRKLFGSVGPNWKYTQEAVHLCIICIIIASIRRARVIRSAGVAPPFPCYASFPWLSWPLFSSLPDGPRQDECTDSNAKMCRDCETELAPVGDICRKGTGESVSQVHLHAVSLGSTVRCLKAGTLRQRMSLPPTWNAGGSLVLHRLKKHPFAQCPFADRLAPTADGNVR